MTSETLTLADLTLDHDGFFQETFQQTRLAQAFLKKVLPKKSLRRLDLAHLTVERRNLTDETFKQTAADLVYRVPIKGTKKHVDFLVIVEHKSQSDALTLFQLWGYAYLACRRFFLNTPDDIKYKVGYRLPPLIAIIVHHGKTKFRAKTELSELFVSLPGLEDFYPKLQAILVDLTVMDDDDPALNDPEVPELKVVLMVLKTVFRQDVGLKVKDVLRELKPYSDDSETRRLIRTIWVYLASNAKHMKRNYEALLSTFEESIGGHVMPTMVEIWQAEAEERGLAIGEQRGLAIGEQRGLAIGEQRGLAIGEARGKVMGEAKGKARGKAEAVIRTLARRLGTVPEEIADRIWAISDIPKLDELFDLAFDCPSLDDFVRYLDR